MGNPFSKLNQPASPPIHWVIRDPFVLAVNPEEDKRRKEFLEQYRLSPATKRQLEEKFKIIDDSSKQRAADIIAYIKDDKIEEAKKKLFGDDARPMTADRIAHILYYLKKEAEGINFKSLFTNSILALFDDYPAAKAKALIGNKLFQTLHDAENFQKQLSAEEFDKQFKSDQFIEDLRVLALPEKPISPSVRIEKIECFINAESKLESDVVLEMPDALEKMRFTQVLSFVGQASDLSMTAVGDEKVEYIFDLTSYAKNFLESIPLPAYFSMTGNTMNGELFKVYIESNDFPSYPTSSISLGSSRSSNTSNWENADEFSRQIRAMQSCYLTLPPDLQITEAYLEKQGRALASAWSRLPAESRKLVPLIELGVEASLTSGSEAEITVNDFASCIRSAKPVPAEEEVLNANSFIDMLTRYKKFVLLLPHDCSRNGPQVTVQEKYFKKIIPEIQQQWQSLDRENKDRVIESIREMYRASVKAQLKADFLREAIKVENRVIAPYDFEEKVMDQFSNFFDAKEGDNTQMCYEHLSQRSPESHVVFDLFHNEDFKRFLGVEGVETANISTDYFLFDRGGERYIKYNTHEFQMWKINEHGGKSDIAKGFFEALFKINKTKCGYYLELVEASLRLPQAVLKEERADALAQYFSSARVPLKSGSVPLETLSSQIQRIPQVQEEQEVQAASSSMEVKNDGDQPPPPSL